MVTELNSIIMIYILDHGHDQNVMFTQASIFPGTIARIRKTSNFKFIYFFNFIHK